MNPNDKAPPEFILESVTWDIDKSLLSFWVNGKPYDLGHDDKFFKDIMPDGEYHYRDEDSGIIYARMDEHNNMHWLVRNFKGLVEHKTVHLKPILEDIAERIINDQD